MFVAKIQKMDLKTISLDKILTTAESLRKASAKSEQTQLQKRAKSKYITLRLMDKMCALKSPLAHGYVRTVNCCTVIKQKDGKLTSRYCGNRWCSVCNRIRSAQYISKYEPILKTWVDTQFVTLTVVNVEGTKLLDKLKEMNKNFRRILDLMRKRNIKTRGIRKVEVTYNKESNTYHPHFHVLVEGKAQADIIHDEWLRLNPTSKEIAQKVKSVDADNVSVYKEIFKYITKLFEKGEDGKFKQVNPTALDIIFRVIKGRRTLQPFGFEAPVVEEEGEIELSESTDAPTEEVKVWVWTGSDWIDIDTGEALSNFRVTRKIEKMLIETGLDDTEIMRE